MHSKGLLAIDVHFFFGKNLCHARLWVLRNREHQIFGSYAQLGYNGGDGELFIWNVYLRVEHLEIGPEAFLWALLFCQQVVARLPVRPGSNEVGHESIGEFFEG